MELTLVQQLNSYTELKIQQPLLSQELCHKATVGRVPSLP